MIPHEALELFAVSGLPIVQPGDDLVMLITDGLTAAGRTLRTGDVVVVAQKIVSKSEGRFVERDRIVPSAEAVTLAAEVGKDPRLVHVVLSESVRVVRKRPNLLIMEHRLGFVMANAGVDHSNVDMPGQTERVLLLPVDPDGSAARLRESLGRRFGVNIGVIINDSFGRAWRRGTCGVAIGVAGLPALIDLRGQRDLLGRTLEVSIVGFADEVAAAASLVQGQADEAQPVVVVRGLSWSAPNGRAAGMVRSEHEDLFR
jgi:coenzyme F420-0:L-glutamate ligase/coenzyme F420-1:gamma-L-glutamate ligase